MKKQLVGMAKSTLLTDVENIENRFFQTARKYNSGQNPFKEIGEIAFLCMSLLEKLETRHQGSIGKINYNVFVSNGRFSRPIRPDMFLRSRVFLKDYQKSVDRLSDKQYLDSTEQDELNKIVYTIISSFSAVYDLFKNSSRKTPGTFFEIVVGSLMLQFYSECIRTKHVPIPGESESIATDIVLTSKKTGKGLVIPVKITTRERIVQPFVHQRILESVFGDKYKSILVAVSEMQRDEETGVNQICVPRTIKLFDKHVAHLSALIYLDPPARYLLKDVTDLLPVIDFAQLFSDKIGQFLR